MVASAWEKRMEKDTTMGCDVNPVPLGCLSCPLVACRYDVPLVSQARARKRDQVIAMLEAGERPSAVWRALGIGKRGYYRFVAEGRRAQDGTKNALRDASTPAADVGGADTARGA